MSRSTLSLGSVSHIAGFCDISPAFNSKSVVINSIVSGVIESISVPPETGL